MAETNFDIIVVGAGISGINAGYRIQELLPGKKYTILEARNAMGGTWDFFKYPGLRSDSDLHTFGFPWRPWTNPRAIAEAPLILDYLHESAEMFGIDKHIQYNRKVTSANWSTDTQSWQCDVQANGEKTVRYNAKYMIWASGYYSYDQPMEARVNGLENFKGPIVHPQFWDEKLDYTNKKVAIVGSGATAITLLPNIAQKASKVTMVQRSPTYIMEMPQNDPTANLLKWILPKWLAFKIIRFKWLTLPFIFFNWCQTFPKAARVVMGLHARQRLPKHIPQDPHFKPSYAPWDQRLCVSPDGDFYKCLRDGSADIATGNIETMTDKTIVMENGDRIDADIVVTATGLRILFAGGSALSIDGTPYHIGDKYIWKSMLAQDAPNAAFVVGYTNASWTLGSDCTAIHFCRLVKTMEARGDTSFCPRVEDESKLVEAPLLHLQSTYVKKGKRQLPRAASTQPWQSRKNYFHDLWEAKAGDLNEGLQYYRVAT